jgi:beta-lactamase regulating signal transducer with metallopeptidase domain
MLFEHHVSDAVRVAVLLGLALAAMPALRRASSSTRRLVLAVALTGALVLPIVSAIAPAWQVDAPAAVSALRTRIIPEAAVEGAAAPSATDVNAAPALVVHAPRASSPVDGAKILAAAWASGALLVLARLAMGIARSRAMVRRAIHARSWSIAIARAEAAVGVRATVRVSDDVDAPAVTGVLAPVVLVPGASESWNDDRRYAVLLHELAHVRQQDCLVQIVGQLACAVNWFNPLAWLAMRRFRIERELAADDAVVAAGARASTYAEDLLAISGASDGARHVPAGALGMAERSQLVQRIKAIVSVDRVRRPLGRGGALLLVAGSASVVLAVACATPAAPKTAVASASPAAPPSPPAAGSTISPALQAIADEELARAMDQWQAEAGTILVLEPSTGAILANAGRAHGAPSDVAVRSAFITGSTLKVVTLAAALEEGVLTPTERIDCERGSWMYQGKAMRDPAANGMLTVPEMLAVSTNVGFSKVFDRLGGARLERWLRAFHFGAAPPIEGATAGTMPARIEDKTYDGAVVAIGESIAASPLQVAAAYAAIANGGAYIAPTLTRRAESAPREQIMKPETARLVVEMLEGAVNSEKATGKRARVDGVRVAGKTGTAGYTKPNGDDGVYVSFVGFFPAAAPRFVVLVGLEQPKDEATGASAAAPVFARVAARAR